MNFAKQSEIFKNLARIDPSRVQKILDEKNMIKVKNQIYIEGNKQYPIDFINLITHAIKGKIASKEVFGIHFFDNNTMKIIKILQKEDKNLVWRAEVEVYDKNYDTPFLKESTFFPKSWSLNQLFHECYFAFINKIKDSKKASVFISKTYSGVPVEIIVKNDEIKSIYPTYTK